ncbi:hypothetical protein [Streptomyces sp. NPDC056227]|uniref:hypothetical protein n=1 Tax=Streptomyces sp. NPDC056227 TaxID=3345753 RepID=UPI0035DDC45C
MHDITLAAGWIQTGTGLGNDIKALIFNVAIPVLCGAFVVIVGWKTKAPGPTIVTPPPRERGGFSLCRLGFATDQPGP